MKSLHKTRIILATLLLSTLAFTSCDWDNSPEPEFPSKVTYSISADYTEFDGPEQLLLDIQAWVQENKEGLALDGNFSSGAASEFANVDAQAAKQLDAFTTKFRNYLNTTVKSALDAGTYGDNVRVNAKFYTYVVRGQGENPSVKTTSVFFTYPETTVPTD